MSAGIDEPLEQAEIIAEFESSISNGTRVFFNLLTSKIKRDEEYNISIINFEFDSGDSFSTPLFILNDNKTQIQFNKFLADLGVVEKYSELLKEIFETSSKYADYEQYFCFKVAEFIGMEIGKVVSGIYGLKIEQLDLKPVIFTTQDGRDILPKKILRG